MAVQDIAGWIGPAATMIAAIMTAANLGSRVTGWGFVVFAVGSVAWSIVAVSTSQQNLLWTNAFLTLVNIVGIWRWLGRQSRYEDGGQAAMERSAAAPVPTLTAITRLPGAALQGRDNEAIGTVIDAMMRSGDGALSYLVVSEGGVGGIAERLHALPVGEIVLSEEGVRCQLSAAELRGRPVLKPDEWPHALGASGTAPRPA